MADHDLIPVKDPGAKAAHDALEQKAAQQRRVVSKLPRDVLEDNYLKLYEERIILKKHSLKQEDKIRRISTKLIRIVNTQKKDAEKGQSKKVHGRDLESEEQLSEMHDKIQVLEKQNAQLKEKLMLAKQQISTSSKRPTSYDGVNARIDTGIPKRQQTYQDPRIAKSLRVTGPAPIDSPKRNIQSPTMPRYGHSVLEDTRHENKQLELQVAQMREQLETYEFEVDNCREQLRLKEAEFEEDIFKIKQQMTAEHRVSLQENIDMIKVQREVKEKSTKLLALQEKYTTLEDNLRQVKRSHDNVLVEMENLNMRVKEEQNKNLTLTNQIKAGNAEQRKMIELQEQIADLENDNVILKEANEKLVGSAFDLEKEREWRQRENHLKVQIAQLEATLKADLGEKGSVLDRLAMERDDHEKLLAEYKQMHIEHLQLKGEYEDLKEKLTFFTKESAIDLSELEEALVLVKQKKQREQPELDFLIKVDEEKGKDSSKKLLELQAEYAETVHELEKTRNMLVVQHKINRDYQQEVGLATAKLEETKKEYETQLDQYARMLDMRASRIKKLEAQLRDVAYGTKQYKVPPPLDDDDTVEFDETIHLERGQNLFEIHVKKVSLSGDGVNLIGDDEPSLFCTWEFFEFEIQSTPVVRGARPTFDFTSQYVVKVDDFFLHYLQKKSCTLELHQSFGQDYKTIAACQLTFRDIFEKTHGRIHGTATLTGIGEAGMGIGFGTCEYWVRLRVPMDQALRLYKERTKALGYITADEKSKKQTLQAMDETAAERPADNVNELHIKLMRCSKLKARRPNMQPSPYCVYQFFDFNDHDTVILKNSNNPEFSDHKTYPVPMTIELDQYLKAMPLRVFVFDDTDPEETSYLGVADIPLLPLAHDKGVKGIFELKRPDNTVNGSVELELRWQYSYLPPKGATRTPAQQRSAPQDEPEKLVLMPGEELKAPAPPSVASPKKRMAAKFSAKGGPSATSTPLAKEKHVRINEEDVDPQLSAVAADSPKKPVAARRLEPHVEEDAENETEIQDAVAAAVTNFLPTESISEQVIEEREPEPQETEEKVEESTLKDELKNGNTLGDTSEIPDEVVIKKDTTPEDVIHEKTPSVYESETPGIETDSDGLVTPTARKLQKQKPKPGSSVTIAINNLSLYNDAPPMVNTAVKRLFVEYKFLDLPTQDLETPYSLPKPKPGMQITYNFSKTFQVDFENNYRRRQMLAGMLLPSDPDKGRIRFTIVSEPPPDEFEIECEDVGVASVSVVEILLKTKDVIDQVIPIYDVKDEKVEIGGLQVTVECLGALQAIEKEMEIEGTY